MRVHTFVRRVRPLLLGAALAPAAAAAAQTGPAGDPRIGLRPGWMDAAQAASGMELVAAVPRAPGFVNPNQMGDFGVANSDLAFQGSLVFVGNFNGWQVYDASDPRNPRIRASLVCPGGQGDLSVWGNLLFMSVEETRGRIDCGTGGTADSVDVQRFRGVRIFDITDLDAPRQVAAVQTCRGSHTHTLVPDPRDAGTMYVYVSGTAQVRPGAELAGCSGLGPQQDPNTSYFQIEVIRVPLAAPQEARVVNAPRVFADPQTGNVAGLWPGGGHGEGTQRTSQTNQCHDITAFPEIGLAAGACSGNGILLDIRDPANPVRVAEVSDPNFAYWHSATFNNDGSTVIYTDEWGGGTAPRCRSTDRQTWGANALFDREGTRLTHRGYFKLPVPQTPQENCVAHNGSIIPVPGRDIMVQAWYQGGVSVFDFTDPARPVEIAFFDRGPMSATELVLGGSWSAYWYNGHVYSSEIGRGLDVLRLLPSEHLTQNEIDAANLVRQERFNAQLQERLTWPAAFPVAKAYVDQLTRSHALLPSRLARISADLGRAERLRGPQQRAALTALASGLDADVAAAADPERVRALAAIVRQLAAGEAR